MSDPTPTEREITAERINIVDADGKVRMTLAGKDSVPDPVVDGVVYERQGPKAAGLHFFNDRGDECGGLTFYGGVDGGGVSAYSGLTLDEFDGGDAVGIRYSEHGGRRSYGLMAAVPAEVGDRMRLFAGWDSELGANISMLDSKGRDRIRIYIDSDDNPKIEFLDEEGRPTRTIGPAE